MAYKKVATVMYMLGLSTNTGTGKMYHNAKRSRKPTKIKGACFIKV